MPNRYHVKADANALHIRFYLWLYDANPNSINTCKLLWAYLLAPLALIIRGAVVVGVTLLDLLPKSKKSAIKPIRKGPGRAERTLDATSVKLSTWYARWQTALKWIGIALGLAIVAGIITLIVVTAINHFVNLLIGLGIIIGVVVFIAVFLALCMWLDDTGRAKHMEISIKNFFTLLRQLGKSFHNHTCAVVDLED